MGSGGIPGGEQSVPPGWHCDRARPAAVDSGAPGAGGRLPARCRRVGDDGARRRADPDPLRRGARGVGRCGRLPGRGALGFLLHRRAGRRIRPLPLAGGGHPVRRRAEAARPRVAAPGQDRGPAARRAGQLPGRPRQALARAAARRHREDRAAGQPRPGAARERRRADHHRGGPEGLGARRGVRELRTGPAGTQRSARRASPSLGRGAREAQAAGADVPAEGVLQLGHGLAAAGRGDPAAQVRGGWPARARAAGAERADAPARRAHRQAGGDLRKPRAHRADAPV